MGNRYIQSRPGIARHCWVNKPDTKFNTDGLFHTKVVYEGQDAVDFKAEIDAFVEKAWQEESAKAIEQGMKPGELKKWSRYYPYEEETDAENGNPTGRLIVMFKQNHKIKLKDGSVKTFFVGIRDRKNKETKDNVFGGATIKVLYSPRNVKMSGVKQFGTRLDFSMVQLIKAAPMSGGGFDEVDGDYADGADNSPGEAAEADEY